MQENIDGDPEDNAEEEQVETNQVLTSTMIEDDSNNCEEMPIEPELMISSLSSGQPDVLSGIILEDQNDTLSQHLETLEAASASVSSNITAEEHSSNTSESSTKSQSSEFESIYDKYRDKSDQDTDHEEEAPKVTNNDNSAAVAFQPAEVTNEELDEMIDDLEHEVNHDLSGAAAALYIAPNVEQLGARPKNSFFSPQSSSAPLAEVVSVNATTTTKEVPDIVMGTENSDDVNVEMPKDSPPPYSEIDPMQVEQEQRPVLTRPTSLDIVNDEDQTTTSPEQVNDVQNGDTTEENDHEMESNEDPTSEGKQTQVAVKVKVLMNIFIHVFRNWGSRQYPS